MRGAKRKVKQRVKRAMKLGVEESGGSKDRSERSEGNEGRRGERCLEEEVAEATEEGKQQQQVAKSEASRDARSAAKSEASEEARSRREWQKRGAKRAQ